VDAAQRNGNLAVFPSKTQELTTISFDAKPGQALFVSRLMHQLLSRLPIALLLSTVVACSAEGAGGAVTSKGGATSSGGNGFVLGGMDTGGNGTGTTGPYALPDGYTKADLGGHKLGEALMTTSNPTLSKCASEIRLSPRRRWLRPDRASRLSNLLRQRANHRPGETRSGGQEAAVLRHGRHGHTQADDQRG
jgi:hypothetical protein